MLWRQLENYDYMITLCLQFIVTDWSENEVATVRYARQLFESRGGEPASGLWLCPHRYPILGL